MSSTGSPPPGWYPTPNGTTAWWDGQQWHQAPPQAAVQVPMQGQVPMQADTVPYAKVATLGAMVRVWFALLALLGAAQAGVAIWRRQLVSQILDGQAVSQATRVNSDDLAKVVNIGAFVAWIVAFVLTAIWCKRIYANLIGPLRSRGVEFSPGWAAGWWFVPFANLVKPLQVLREAWKASSPTEQPDSMAWKVTKAPSLITTWWVLVVVATLGMFAMGSSGDSTDALRPSEFQGLMVRTAAVGALRVGVGLVALAVVAGIAKRHLARARWLGVVAP